MRLFGIVIGASLMGATLGMTAAFAQPSVPATFFGSVTINGQAAPTGTEIRGLIGGTDCTQSAPGERPAIREGEATAYVIAVVHESQRPGCGRPGLVVTFTINGEQADQAATWEAGPIHIDLSVGPGGIIPLPTATPTVPGAAPTSTNLPSEPAPIPGTPPTDDVTFPGTTQSPPGIETPGGDGIVSAAGSDRDRGGGASLAPIVIAVLAIIAVAGAATGFALSRRRS